MYTAVSFAEAQKWAEQRAEETKETLLDAMFLDLPAPQILSLQELLNRQIRTIERYKRLNEISLAKKENRRKTKSRKR
jgi:hypothetical protein